MEKLVSIVVPIYNVERYLDDCLRSIVNQRQEQVEILLIDDGSTDGSGSICEACAEAYGNVRAYHKPNGGLSDARNYGLARAAGRYVIFLDADDFLAKGALERICVELEAEDVQMLAWNGGIVEETGEISRRDARYYQHEGLVSRRRYTGMQMIDAELKHHGDYATVVWLGAYQRHFLMEHGLWFEKGLLHEDELWTQKVLLNCDEILYVDEILYFYRKRENSIMARAERNCSPNLNAWLRIYAELTEYCGQKISDRAFLKRLKGNLAKRSLHAIARYGLAAGKDTLRRIDRRTILRDAQGALDKVRAMILCGNVHLYCRMSDWFKRRIRGAHWN